MKKITLLSTFMALAIAVALTSCTKDQGILTSDQYNGDTKVFIYSPSLVSPTGVVVNPNSNVATVRLSNGSSVNIDCLTPNQSGDGLIMECPIIPLEWLWNQSGRQYVPSGFAYNVKFGFTNYTANVWFVERSIYGNYTLKNKSVNWGNTLSPGQWTSSFRGLSGISELVMPMTGKIGFGNTPNTYYFTL